tara:strand:+ start:1166 stop:1960 length:795 start_codon:yes stop_codon:yes gene_type:complete
MSDKKRVLKGYVEKIDKKETTVVGVASTSSIDRSGDTVSVKGWDFEDFRKNPVLTWNHDLSKPPIGKVMWIKEDGGKITFKAKFNEASQFNKTISKMYKDGFLNAFSVGFKPTEMEPNEKGGMNFLKQQLLELAAVTVPDNQDALAIAVKNFDNEVVKEISKSVCKGKEKGKCPMNNPECASYSKDSNVEELKEVEEEEVFVETPLKEFESQEERLERIEAQVQEIHSMLNDKKENNVNPDNSEMADSETLLGAIDILEGNDKS